MSNGINFIFHWSYLTKILTSYTLLLIIGCSSLQSDKSDYEVVDRLAKEQFNLDYQIVHDAENAIFYALKLMKKKNDHAFPYNIILYLILGKKN